jgi:phosphopantothenoylcysteine decarboxylase/phosphopantothenate--cysteine ligase
VTLISGPVSLPAPPNITLKQVTTAEEMLTACLDSLPADIAVCAAAVADWAPKKIADHKIKKRGDKTPPAIVLKENPDILKTLCTHKLRPHLTIGFAAETNNLIDNAKAKIKKKKCDWILANDVSDEKVFGKTENHVHFITIQNTENWNQSPKAEIARRLVKKIVQHYDR